jgi:hypothetical protein
MKPHARELRAAADDMLGQLRPRNVLRDAIDLVIKLSRDEVFREYVTDRVWIVIGVVFTFFLVSTVCSVDLMFRVGRLASDSPLWLKGFALVVGVAVWSGGFLAQTYVFLIWLEERAAHRHREEQGIRLQLPRGFLPYLKYSRALPPWIVVLACVVLPLSIMARNAPLVALAIAALAIAAPVVFGRLDR